MPRMRRVPQAQSSVSDPVTEVEATVEQILEEHFVLFGCDDPACAVRTSTYVESLKPRSWWQRLFARGLFAREGR